MSEQNNQTPEFTIMAINLKSISYDSQLMPHQIQGEWQPDAKVDIHTEHQVENQEAGLYRVSLRVTVEARNQDQDVFKVVATRSGLFVAKHFNDQQLEEVLSVNAPIIIFPYSRQDVSDAIVNSGFPPLYLRPVDFYTIYQQKKTQGQQAN